MPYGGMLVMWQHTHQRSCRAWLGVPEQMLSHHGLVVNQQKCGLEGLQLACRQEARDVVRLQ